MTKGRSKTGKPKFQELGLVCVILLLGGILTLFSGSIRVRDPQTGAVTTANRFLRADNLDKLAKNASFFAIMAVGATLVILTSGIDLSVGATYCLAAVTGAMFLHYFGPAGPGSHAPPWIIVAAAVGVTLGAGTLCGLVNGSLVVLLRVHPFVITLGTMAIYRGIAFVTTKGQSFTHFPPQFTNGFIRYEIGKNLYPVPMAIMILVTVIAGVYLRSDGGRAGNLRRRRQ